MNRFFLICLFSVLLCLLSFTIMAQDPRYSQYLGNELNLNPGYTGTARDLRFGLTYRTLWPNVPGKKFPGPLSTYNGNLDFMVKFMKNFQAGIGFNGGQDIEGQGFLTTSSFGVSYCQHMPNIRKKGDMVDRFNIYLGFRTSINQVKLNWDRLVFSDQLSPTYGVLSSPSSYYKEGTSSRLFVDLDLGLVVRNNFRGNDVWFNELSFGISHVLSPNISITGSTAAATRLPRRYIAAYRAAIKTSNQFFVGPLVVYEHQGKYTSLKAGIDFYFKLKNNKNQIPLLVGIYHHTGLLNNMDTRSFIIALGHRGAFSSYFQKRYCNYSLGLSADFTYGGLNMQTFGAYELTFGLTIPTKLSVDYYDQKCVW